MDEAKEQVQVQDEVSKPTPPKPLIHDFGKQVTSFSFAPQILAILAVFLILGSLSGFLLAKGKTGGLSLTGSGGSVSSISKGTIIGSNDTKTFKDKTEGVLKKGGIDGEGQYHLVRPGGESQNVYLTSSIVDLSDFLDRKIRVWGETQKAQLAGWLMDVGRVEVLE